IRPDVDPEEDAEPVQERADELRLLEAMLFAAAEPLSEKELAERLPQGTDVGAALKLLQKDYASRGVNLVRVASKWTFRTAGDLSWLLSKETVETRKLSRAAIETSSRARVCSMDACRRASECRCRPTIRRCARTRTRSSRATSISASRRGATTPRNSAKRVLKRVNTTAAAGTARHAKAYRPL